MQASRLVTLTGTGGSGKTRLALQIAAELIDADRRRRLVHRAGAGRPTGPRSRAGGGRARPARPGRARPGAVVAEALGDQDALILLDNCEHLIAGAAKLGERIIRSCPRVRILATSREPLGIDGRARVPGARRCRRPTADERRGARRQRRGAAVRRPGPAARARLRAGRADGRAGRDDLPAAGRHPARASSWPPRGCRAMSLRQDRRAAGRALPAADRRQPHRDAAPADAAGDGRLVATGC